MLEVLILTLQSVGNKPSDNSGSCHISEVCKNSTGLWHVGLSFPGEGRLLHLTPLKTKTGRQEYHKPLWVWTAAHLACRYSAPGYLMGTQKVARFDQDQEKARQCGSFVPGGHLNFSQM